MKQIFTIGLLSFATMAFAGEGMWIPLLLKALNEGEMQEMGMKMTAEDIYSVNKGSLKDAIVHFGGFCTAEVISQKGLILTNHHCGYGQIQSHTTVENNYLKEGFWAKSFDKELANPGLTATFIEKIYDVTEVILEGVTDDMDSETRQSMIDVNIDKCKKRNQEKLEAYQEVKVKPFYNGNQYFMFFTITYEDVRLVGTPPESIGKFGADTDNWVWPRHTGDFALFRIYADENNLPAPYSESNIPFKPKHSLPISMDGVEEGDFTMVFGFPGRTNQYLPSSAVTQIVDVLNPAKINIRDKALKLMDAEMRKDESTRIQYASKFARIANYWKKWKGESQGLKATDGIGRKVKFEKEFMDKVKNNPEWTKAYGELLPNFHKLYEEIQPYALTRDYYSEVFSRNIELMSIAGYMNRLSKNFKESGAEGYNGFKGRLVNFLPNFFKNYNPEIDKKVFAELVELYDKNVPIKEVNILPALMADHGAKNYQELAESLYSETMLTDAKKVEELFAMDPKAAVEKINKDKLCQAAAKISGAYNDHSANKYNEIKAEIDASQRLYMKALLEVFKDLKLYPDANGTMRVTYGKVAGYQPEGKTEPYNSYTYLDGVIAKYKPGDYEFDLPEKLIDLYEKQDFGPYHVDGKVPVCFIGSNHTTGGNSGSPAIDAHGNLVGLNFDRVWEGTMSDINYDASICRNIMVDARYILFIIDKFAGADNIIKEIKKVYPKGHPGKRALEKAFKDGKVKTAPTPKHKKQKTATH